MPQMIMLIHASSVNRKRAGLDRKTPSTKKSSAPPESYKSDDTPMWRGKRIDQLNTVEYQAYLRDN